MTIAPALEKTIQGSVDAEPVVVETAGRTDIGRKRTANEDAYLIASVRRGLMLEATSVPDFGLPAPTTEGTLLMIADGMGGEGSGDVASRIAIEGVALSLCGFLPWVDRKLAASTTAGTSLNDVRAALGSALVAGDANVDSAAHSPGNSPTMGTTLTLAYVLYPVLYVAHVGDSRCYLYRSGQLSQLTRDHTLAEQISRGGQSQAPVPDRYRDVLYNALGAGLGAKPEVSKLVIRRGDVVLLCSDGLTKHVNGEEIAGVLGDNADPQWYVDRLVAFANERGGSDNVTVVAGAVR